MSKKHLKNTFHKSREHTLKIYPSHFRDVRSGRKTGEVRLNDRDYQVGDSLLLIEYDPDGERFTNEFEKRVVSHVLLGGMHGLDPKYCVLSFEPLKKFTVHHKTCVDGSDAAKRANYKVILMDYLNKEFPAADPDYIDDKINDYLKTI